MVKDALKLERVNGEPLKAFGGLEELGAGPQSESALSKVNHPLKNQYFDNTFLE